MTLDIDIAEQFEKHLNSPKQTWLLGAGVSFLANIPLMLPLTERVLALVRGDQFADDEDAIRVLNFITRDCGETSHIEHYLTHLGDLISIAERSRTGGIEISGQRVAKDKLIEVHGGLIEQIASTVRWGFRAAHINAAGENVEEQIGSNRGHCWPP